MIFECEFVNLDVKNLIVNKMSKILLVLIAFLICSFFNFSHAQTTQGLTAKDFLEYDDYNRALEEFLKLYKDKKDNLEINFDIGYCYLHINDDRSKAIPYLEYVYKNDKAGIELTLNLGLAYMYNYDFNKAIQYFNEYRSKISPKKYEEVDRYIENCENGKVLLKNPVNVTFQNLGKTINTKFPDYYPFITQNESVLYFTSRREGNARKIKSWQGYYTADIYYSNVKSGEWTKPKNIGSAINTLEDEQCVGITPDGKNMIIYMDNGIVSGDLFITSTTKSKAFPKPIPFPEPINTKDLELEACITQDGNMLIVASDRPGSLGGADLFMFKKLPNGEWGAAKNMGPNINTVYNEAFPVYDEKNKIIYFASEGHTNMGGYDIFKSKFNVETQEFGPAVNMGYPINTPEDNMEFTLAENKHDGYVSAVRKEGFGDLDIYKIIFNDIEVRPSIIKGIVSVDDSLKGDIDAFITITDVATKEELDAKNANPKSGKFIFAVDPGKKYILTVTSPGFEDITQEVMVYDKSDYVFEIEKNILLRKPGPPPLVPSNKNVPGKKTPVNKNIKK